MKCTTCDGKGHTRVRPKGELRVCRDCDGTGQKGGVRPAVKCLVCEGSGNGRSGTICEFCGGGGYYRPQDIKT